MCVCVCVGGGGGVHCIFVLGKGLGYACWGERSGPSVAPVQPLSFMRLWYSTVRVAISVLANDTDDGGYWWCAGGNPR